MTKIRNTQYHIIIYAIIITIILLMLALIVRSKVDAGPLNSTEWYVPDDFPDIQSAIDAIDPGDIIWVRPGNYVGSLDYGGKQIAIRSTDGPEVTTITGNGGTAVILGGPGAEMTGFTITGGAASFGAGMSVSGVDTLIQGNIFDGNAQGAGGFGAGIGGNSASPIIDGNIFRNNSCDSQFLSGVIVLVNSSSPLITNNIFENNPCRGINMTLPVGNAPQVINNTFYNNDVGIRVDRRVDTGAQTYRNNIIVNNTIGVEVDFGTDADNPVWENNLVFGNTTNYVGITDQTGMNGNISVDPEFLDSEYHLKTISPAVNTGTNTGCPTADFNDVPRPQGFACDMGAYEVIYTEAGFSMNSFTVVEGNTAVITVSLGITLPVTATVDYLTIDGTAMAGTDYIPVSGTLSFIPGSPIQTFSVISLDDDLIEGDQYLNLVLLNPNSAGAFVEVGLPATIFIIDNDFAAFLPFAASE